MKNIVITGSTRGIGLAMAEEFLKAGCNVTVSGRGETFPEILSSRLNNYSAQYVYIKCDVQKKSEIIELWEKSSQKWGKIDIWINNAGMNSPYVMSYETDEEYVENIVNTNIEGMIFGSQVAAENMLKQGSGAIYSMEGLGSNDMIQEKTIIYGTTKRALTYFMRGLAKELSGTNVIAGRLSPGMMLTDFITKSPDGEQAAIYKSESFKRAFNILADKPETVAKFFIPKILANTKNDCHIMWLTNLKAAWRFMTAAFRKDRLI